MYSPYRYQGKKVARSQLEKDRSEGKSKYNIKDILNRRASKTHKKEESDAESDDENCNGDFRFIHY